MAIQLIDENILYTLHFADDQMVIAQDKENKKNITTKPFAEYGK